MSFSNVSIVDFEHVFVSYRDRKNLLLSFDQHLETQLTNNVRFGNFTPCWFSLNKSETVKAVTLALCSIQ